MIKNDINNFLNKDINGLIIIREVKSIGKGLRVECKCVECGKYKEFNLSQLIHRKGKNSCGCLRFALGNKSPRWKGYEEISSVVFKQLIRGAKSRGLEFNVTIEQIWDLFIKQDRRCALSGERLIFGINRFDYTSASLDRINPKIGYILGNLQWIHKDINYAKQSMTNKELLDMVTKIYKHNF